MRSWRRHMAYNRTGYPCVKDEPDIDIDFKPDSQMKIYNYLTEKYGDRNKWVIPTIQFTRGRGKGLSMQALKDIMQTYTYQYIVRVNQETPPPIHFYDSSLMMWPRRGWGVGGSMYEDIWAQWFGRPTIRYHRDIISPQIRIQNGKEAVVVNAHGQTRLHLSDVVMIIGQPEDIREGLDMKGEAQYLVMRKRNNSVRAKTVSEYLREFIKGNVDIFSFHCTRFVEASNKKMKSKLTRLEIL